MQTKATTYRDRPDSETTDCERCGRDRPVDPQRFAVTATDQTDATIQTERALLCQHCWEQALDELRRGIA